MILRSEYPRPDLVRHDWIGMNGEWEFAFDDQDQGLVKDWAHDPKSFTKKIIVPFPYQSPLSGIGDPAIHPVIWYHRFFTIPSDWAGKQVIIHFGACDYETFVWINGCLAGSHRGGYASFHMEISALLQPGLNEVTIRVVDRDSISQPRGKQNAKDKPWGCWYTRVSGIWQSVWMEPVSPIHLEHLKLTPDIDRKQLNIRYCLNQFATDLELRCRASFQGKIVADTVTQVTGTSSRYADEPQAEGYLCLGISDLKLWSPEEPQLYDLRIELHRAGEILDTVESYFGMRQIGVEEGRICLNHRPYYLRMVLDQGFWPDGIYTPMSIVEFEKDIKLTKAMGFNGTRKHQKIEDPYFYYYCDRMGLLVWEEMPSCYRLDEAAVQNLSGEWQHVIKRDYNHPSIMAWIPMNESWGVEPLLSPDDPSQYKMAVRYLETLYYLTKTLDETRLVISNDGWQQAVTDLISIHEYTQDSRDLDRRYQAFKQDRHGICFSHKLQILLPGYEYRNQPLMITEFGGVKVEEQQAAGWGYGEAARTYQEMVERIDQLVAVIAAEKEICGFCYTQLTDVEQEINGLLDHEHRPKVDPEQLARIFGRE